MHDLWIFPAPRSSRWFARMDWYLNWQMSKGLSYGGLHLPYETYQIAEHHGVPLDVGAFPQPDLLVLPGSRVPTKKCLVLDDADRPLETWFRALVARAAQLNASSARVFLPTGRTKAEAEAAWASLGTNVTADFDVDLENPK